MRSIKSIAAMLAVFSLAGAAAVQADDRKFTYSYEAKTLPQGTWEFEQWATLQAAKNGGRWGSLLFREEIEYGVTDRLNASIYLNLAYQGNRGVPGFDDDLSFGFESMSTEWKYKLTDPAADPIGVLLYAELAFSDGAYEIETKLVLSKEIGPWTFAYNFIYEAEYSKSDDPAQIPQWTWEHEIFNTVGVSYSFSPKVAIGVEAYDAYRIDYFNNSSTHAFFVGPNVHVSGGSWWATLTFLRQVTSEFSDDDNTKYSVRLIIGVNF